MPEERSRPSCPWDRGETRARSALKTPRDGRSFNEKSSLVHVKKMRSVWETEQSRYAWANGNCSRDGHQFDGPASKSTLSTISLAVLRLAARVASGSGSAFRGPQAATTGEIGTPGFTGYSKFAVA